MLASIGIIVLPLFAALCGLTLLCVALVARRHEQPVQATTDFEDTPVLEDDGPRIWVSSHTLQSLQPVITKITFPNRRLVDELRLVTRWHWLSLLRPTVRKHKRQRKPMKPQELLFIVAVIAVVGPAILVSLVFSSPFLDLLLVLLIGLAAWTKWLLWRSTYLVITDSLVAVIVSPPPGVFWINPKRYPFPVRRIENATFDEIVAARQFFGAEVGNVHAITLEQLEDDWILDMKLLPDPPTIYRVLSLVCPKIRGDM